jgi:peptidoglycan/LPS O-acetylase OafA/YrhL
VTTVAGITPDQQLPPAEAPIRSSKKNVSHIPTLDGIRAVAVILVFVAHSGLDKLVPGGLGVTIFFFLSGYLITTLMRKEIGKTGTLDIKKFYARRALRIFPPLYITLALCLIVVMTGIYPSPLQPIPVILQFIHLANYARWLGFEPGLIPTIPLWSLAVEEHFYLFFPLLYLFLTRRFNSRQQALVLLGICAITLGFRIVTALTVADYHEIYNWTHTRVDSLLFGCILAVWSNPALDDDADSYVPTLAHLAAAIVLMLACLLIRSEFFRQTFRYTAQGIALFFMFSYTIRLRGGPVYRLLVNKPMQVIGLLSYTFYLSHFFVLSALAVRLPHVSHLNRSLLGLVISFCYAGLMYLLIEKPLAKIRARLH